MQPLKRSLHRSLKEMPGWKSASTLPKHEPSEWRSRSTFKKLTSDGLAILSLMLEMSLERLPGRAPSQSCRLLSINQSKPSAGLGAGSGSQLCRPTPSVVVPGVRSRRKFSS